MVDSLSIPLTGLTVEELRTLVFIADSRGLTVSQYIIHALRDASLAFRLANQEE